VGVAGREVDEVVAVEFQVDVVGVALRVDVEQFVRAVDAERDVVRDHVGGLHRAGDVAALDDDVSGKVQVRQVGLLADGVGVDEREGVLQAVDGDVELAGLPRRVRGGRNRPASPIPAMSSRRARLTPMSPPSVS